MATSSNIADLISGTFTGNEASYLTLTESGGNTIVSIDRDGAGSSFGFEDFVVLQGVSGLNLDTLLGDHSIRSAEVRPTAALHPLAGAQRRGCVR